MKLWQKIFLCMFLLSLASVGIYGITTMHENHLENLEREMDRSSSEIELFAEAIRKASDSLGSTSAAVSWYSNYYEQKGISFALFENGKPIVPSPVPIPEDTFASMLDITTGEKILYVRRLSENSYFLTAKLLKEDSDTVLFSIRDITSLYAQKAQKERTFVLWISVFSIVMALFSFFVTKLLLCPLNALKKNAQAMNQGIYEIQCAEGNDEIGKLGAAFNSMVASVADRETILKNESDKKQLFIDAMTHEMNTPLTSIQGYAQFLRGANCTEEQREKALLCIETEARRMHEMYQKLRALQLTDTDGMVKEKLLLAEIAVQVREELEPLLQQKNLSVREYFQTPFLETDRMLLHLLLSNLIRNSANYSEYGGQIYLSLQTEPDGAYTLSVQDFGCGIPKDCLDKVTEPFYRVDKSRSRATGGSGIGLYLCREIMVRLGGSLDISSTEGKGTTVNLHFYNSDTVRKNARKDGQVE